MEVRCLISGITLIIQLTVELKMLPSRSRQSRLPRQTSRFFCGACRAFGPTSRASRSIPGKLHSLHRLPGLWMLFASRISGICWRTRCGVGTPAGRCPMWWTFINGAFCPTRSRKSLLVCCSQTRTWVRKSLLVCCSQTRTWVTWSQTQTQTYKGLPTMVPCDVVSFCEAWHSFCCTLMCAWLKELTAVKCLSGLYRDRSSRPRRADQNMFQWLTEVLQTVDSADNRVEQQARRS